MLLGDMFDLSLRGRAGAVGLVCDGPAGRHELTFREIADLTALPQGTVATRYRRALESLRGWLATQLR